MVARVVRMTRVGTMNTEVEAPHTQVSCTQQQLVIVCTADTISAVNDPSALDKTLTFSYGKEQTAWLHSDSFSL